jgi:hypothetical protein
MLAHLMCHNTVGAQEVAAVETSEKEKKKGFHTVYTRRVVAAKIKDDKSWPRQTTCRNRFVTCFLPVKD